MCSREMMVPFGGKNNSTIKLNFTNYLDLIKFVVLCFCAFASKQRACQRNPKKKPIVMRTFKTYNLK